MILRAARHGHKRTRANTHTYAHTHTHTDTEGNTIVAVAAELERNLRRVGGVSAEALFVLESCVLHESMAQQLGHLGLGFWV